MSDPSLQVALEQRGRIPLDVRFACAPGRTVALIGPSGAGKSTILRSIAGLYRPDVAVVRCAGSTWLDTARGIELAPHERRTGLVFQSYALFPHLTALENVAIALGHVPRAERRAAAIALLERVNLNGFEARRPGALSGGEQQRVALARALARDPAVLLLDEPFAAIDRRTRRHLREDLLRLRSQLRAPIVLVTHDLDDAIALADEIVVIDRGRMLQSGPARDVMTAPASDEVRAILDLSTPVL